MIPYVPAFTCEYCGESKSAVIQGQEGYFVPCQCKQSREKRDQAHYMAMEEKKKRRRGTK